MMELAADLEALWQRFQQQSQLPQAVLLVSAEGRSCDALVCRIQARFLCEDPASPCGQCRHCQSLQSTHYHPDSEQIAAEENTLKIEAIRELQSRILLGPQWANCRVIYFPRLEQLTLAASNALLKILEEPPQRIVFLAVTHRPDRLLPTILSRFERWIVPSLNLASLSYLDPQRWAFQTDKFRELLAQQARLWEEYCAWKSGRINLSQLSIQWSKHEGTDLYQVFYCMVAERIRQGEIAMPAGFKMLDQSMKKIQDFQACPTLNAQLALEDWLISM